MVRTEEQEQDAAELLAIVDEAALICDERAAWEWSPETAAMVDICRERAARLRALGHGVR